MASAPPFVCNPESGSRENGQDYGPLRPQIGPRRGICDEIEDSDDQLHGQNRCPKMAYRTYTMIASISHSITISIHACDHVKSQKLNRGLRREDISASSPQGLGGSQRHGSLRRMIIHAKYRNATSAKTGINRSP